MDAWISIAAYIAGGFTGFMVAAFFAAGARHEERTFDGGFSHDHTSPPVRTVIWSKNVNERDGH